VFSYSGLCLQHNKLQHGEFRLLSENGALLALSTGEVVHDKRGTRSDF